MNTVPSREPILHVGVHFATHRLANPSCRISLTSGGSHEPRCRTGSTPELLTSPQQYLHSHIFRTPILLSHQRHMMAAARSQPSQLPERISGWVTVLLHTNPMSASIRISFSDRITLQVLIQFPYCFSAGHWSSYSWLCSRLHFQTRLQCRLMSR